MYKWIVGAIIGFAIIASFSVIKFGLGPKAIPIIKPSNFEDPAELGHYIHRQLYQRLKTSSPLIFGFNSSNVYEQKVVESLINLIDKDLKDKTPEILLKGVDQSYSKESDPAQLQKKYGDNFLAFTLINLKDTEEATDLKNCETEHDNKIWIECTKKQKVRQMTRAKKVDLKKPIAVVETQSQQDIMVYIRE